MARLTRRDVATVRRTPLFASVGDDELRALLEACRTIDFRAGQQVFRATGKAEGFYVILSGRVKVYKLSPRGEEQILHLYGPGETFAEAAMWAVARYPAHAEVVADAKLLAVSRSALKKAIARNAELALNMMAGLSAKLMEFNELIEQLSLREAPARLGRALLELSRQAGAETIRLEQTKRQLAAQIGTAAETLSRTLRRLSASGLIRVRGREITILDREGLELLARN